MKLSNKLCCLTTVFRSDIIASMKKRKFIFRSAGFSFMLFFLLPAAFTFAQAPVTQAKAVQKEEVSWDFGKIRQGSIVTHEFKLKNETKKPLVIKDLMTSCGCTASKVKEKNIAPGKETILEVKFNSKGYVGSVQKHIFVTTDNPDNPVISYMIKADVVR